MPGKTNPRWLLRSDRGIWGRFVAGILGASIPALAAFAQAPCKAPDDLEAQVKEHADAGAYASLGTWFGEHKQFECANQAFRSALELDPDSAKLNYFLAFSLYSSGQLEQSIAALQRSIQANAKAIQPRLLLAAACHQLGRKDEEEAQWKAALQIDPASADALDGLANLMIDQGDPQAAIDLLRHSKGDQDLTLDLARAYGVAGMLDDAASTLNDALAADPASLRLRNALATVYVHQRRFQDAVALMRIYVQQHPSDVEGQIYLLRALVLNNNTDEARPLGRKLLAASPHDFDVLYLNGILERQAGEYATARDHLLEAVKQQPEDYSSRYNLGAALAHLDDPAGAKLQLEKAVALDPSQAEAHFQLASVLRQLGDALGAQEQVRIYQQLSKASAARAQADTKSQMAAQKLEAGDAKQAASLYREAVAATPDDALLNYKLSLALDQAGDIPGERAALEQAVKLDPTLAIAQNQLGYLLSRDGSHAAAEEHFRAAVKAAPEFTEAWINLAATLGAQAHYPEAQEAVATALRLDPNNAQAQQLSQQLTAAAHR
jgi:tetratricopeptide (TPR) repeat protein